MAVLSAVLAAVPSIAVMIVVFTFGLAFPVTFLPIFTIYLAAALLPATAAELAHLGRPFKIGAGVLGVLAVALGVPWLVERSARQAAAELAGGDHLETGQSRPRSVEFVRSAESFGGGEPLQHAPCDAVCQRLLLGREVDWVRVIAVAEGSRRVRRTGERTPYSSVGAAVTYRREVLASCPPAFADAATALPETRRSLALGTCIVPEVDGAVSGQVPNAQVRVRTAAPWSAARGEAAPSASLRWRRQVEVSLLRPEGDPRRLARRTELEVVPPRFPFLIVFDGYGFDLRPTISRSSRVFQPTDMADLLRTTVGYRIAWPEGGEGIGTVEAGPTPSPTELVRALLNRPGDSLLGSETATLVAEHMRSLKAQSTLTADDAELVRRVVQDRRIMDAGVALAAADILRKHADLAAGLVPDILARLAVPVDERVGHANNQYGWVLARLPAEAWRPHRDRILAILERDRSWVSHPLLTTVGRLGVDPVPLIRERLGAESEATRSRAAEAACAAEPEWQAALAPVLAEFLRTSRVRFGAPHGDELAAMLALRRYGRDEEASALIERRYGARDRAADSAKRRVFDPRASRPDGSIGVEACRRF